MLMLLKIYQWNRDRKECKVYDTELDKVRVMKYCQFLWTDKNGKIPEGYEIHHIDGNCNNDDIENLSCMSASEHMHHHSTLRSKEISARNRLTRHDEEWKKNQSERSLELWKDPEYAKRVTSKTRGLKRSKETCERISAARLGKHFMTEEGKARQRERNSLYTVTDILTGETFSSLVEAAKHYKHDKKYFWRHKELFVITRK